MKRTKVLVTQDSEDVVEKTVLAKAILDMSAAMKKLSASSLNRRAIVCLVHDACNVGKPDIRAVLDSLESLQKDYLHAK